MNGLAGRTAPVTGGARGIGYAIAQRLVREGVSVALVALHQDSVDQAVSVLCPGFIRTRIVDADRNRPERLGQRPEPGSNQVAQMLDVRLRQLVDTGMEPTALAEQVLDAVRNARFWILHNAEDYAPLITDLAASVVEGRDPPALDRDSAPRA